MNIQQTLELAQKHQQSGRLSEAESLYKQILQRQPNRDDVLHQLGILAFRAGRFAEAEQYFRSAIAANFRKADYHYGLGVSLSALNRPREAIAAFEQAITLRSVYPEAHVELGILLAGQGQMADAVAQFERATAARPDLPEAHVNLGTAWAQMGQVQKAIAAFRRALELRPNYAEALSNLGNALADIGQVKDAIAACQRAVALRPDYAPAHGNLGRAYYLNEELEKSVSCCMTAISLRPTMADAHNNLANALKDMGQIASAMSSYAKAAQYRTDSAEFDSNQLFAMHYSPDHDLPALISALARWNQLHGVPRRRFRLPHDNDRSPDRKLRIGYVSADFRDHACAFFLVPLLSQHDHEHFEIVFYAEIHKPDGMTDRFRAWADHWRDTLGLSDEELAAQIRRDGIDILVDAKLHSAENRLTVFAHKPAPIQVSWLGYPGSSGLETIDYRLTDHQLENDGGSYPPPEKPAFVPDCFWCYDPLTDGPPVNELPALTTGHITFASLNNFCKVNEPTLANWAAVMRAVTNSKLLVLAPKGSARDWLVRILQAHGVEPARVEFLDRRPRREYLEYYHRIDLCLDTHPYNGHTTSLDALWMGVPVLTLVGQTPPGRVGLTHAANLNLTEFAAAGAQALPTIASRWAADLPRLAELRRDLRQRMQNSPLMDAAGFARKVEAIYRQMWIDWCGQSR
ncbi:MAG: tetratricopeptide repeat protein [Tepidisphaeraceae bacterium]|jgi:predicted O-linked N-acetylglucosamine transferase (SPINDLY family)